MSKSSAVAILFVLLMGIGAIIVAREFRGAIQRPSVQRQLHRTAVKRIGEALQVYRSENKAWPDSMVPLLRQTDLELAEIKGYRYRKPPDDAPAGHVVAWSEAYHPAIPAGKPWGAEGQVAERDVPAVAYVLNAGLEVEEVDAGGMPGAFPGRRGDDSCPVTCLCAAGMTSRWPARAWRHTRRPCD